MANSTVLLVQPEITYPPDDIAGRHQVVRQKEQYIEIGLLAVASHLQANSFSTTILNLSSSGDIHELEDHIRRSKPRLVGIACMSGFSYPALKLYCSLVKKIDRRIFTFTGGQHSGPLGVLALEEIPDLDCVVRHEGEGSTLELCHALVSNVGSLETIPGLVIRLDGQVLSTLGHGTQIPPNQLADLNYQLFPRYSEFVPRLEESRGCPYDCAFCSNASTFTFKVRYKSVERLVRELKFIWLQYGKPEPFRFYLIAKNYGLDKELTSEFAQAIRSLPFKVEWRSQTRGDIIDPEVIPLLSESGLRVLDLGVETASPSMIQLMNKASDPERYLSKTAAVIDLVAKLPRTMLKINLLFHPGETAETLRETLEFLFQRRDKIDAVTASPVMIDPGAPLWHNLEYFERTFGTRRRRNEFWDTIHTYPVDPSHDLTFEQCNVMASIITKMFQTKEAYFATRLFGGLPRGTDVEHFASVMSDVPPRLRPYSERLAR